MPAPLFMPGQKDNSNNFTIQRARDMALLAAFEKYPLLDEELLSCLFPDVHPRKLSQRLYRLSGQVRTPRPKGGKRRGPKPTKGPAFIHRTAMPDGSLIYSKNKIENVVSIPHRLDGVKLAVAMDCAIRGTAMKITRRLYEDELRALKLKAGREMPVVPDLFLLLEHARPEPLFVEIDTGEEGIVRSDEEQTSLRGKALKYYDSYEQLKKFFAIRSFRVLVLTYGPRRVQNILTEFSSFRDTRFDPKGIHKKEYPLQAGTILVGEMGQIDPWQPSEIFSKIWRSPKDENLYSLV